jgi:hypothetical protein
MNRLVAWIALLVTLLCGGMTAQNSSPARDINAVLAAHDRELLAIKGVVGVYVGVIEGTKRPCLTVMLATPSAETERAIPPEIEGYPVVTRVTGEIRPLVPKGSE